MPTMDRRPLPTVRDMNNDAREIVVAPALLRRQSLRKPNAPPVACLAPIFRPERPFNSDEHNRREPIPERILRCHALTAYTRRSPFSNAKM
eukprot:9029209-Pyramimonas_sp.AAC.1